MHKDGENSETTAANEAVEQENLTPAARRALAEAQARREKHAYDPSLPKEQGGRKGPEPTRYGDWEKDGIVSDF